MDKKKIIALVNIIVITAAIAIITVFMFVLERPTVSQIENRELAKFPEFSAESLFSGSYTDEISNFFNDTVPERDMWKRWAANIQNLKGISLAESGKLYGGFSEVTTVAATETEPPQTTIPNEEPIIGDSGIVTTVTTTEAPSETSAPETTTTAETEKPQNEIADGVVTNGQLVVFRNGHYRGMSLYGGGTGESYAASLNRFAEDLDGIATVYSMIAPTSSEYYCPSNYAAYNASQSDSINNINSLLSDKVVPIDIVKILGQHTDEEIYTRTDHHWQPLGAYYAAEEFARVAGTPFKPLSDFKKVAIDGYVGTLYSFTESADLLNDPEQFVYYHLPNSEYSADYYTTDFTYEFNFPLYVEQPVSQSYSTFMGGDKKIVKISTECKNGRKLAIMKDSYGNAEVPFYIGSFEEIYVIDIRYFDLNANTFIKEQGITDVLFTMCTFSAVGSNANNIEIIRTQ